LATLRAKLAVESGPTLEWEEKGVGDRDGESSWAGCDAASLYSGRTQKRRVDETSS
jgi:hypothetical protein